MDHPNLSTEAGRAAENQARVFLKKQGLEFIQSNFVAYRHDGKACGEIDLIMRDATHYVFVEVKYRQKSNYGHTTEIVSKQKQARIIRATRYFLLQNGLWDSVFSRFDIIGISPQKIDPIVWIKNAFEVQY